MMFNVNIFSYIVIFKDQKENFKIKKLFVLQD